MSLKQLFLIFFLFNTLYASKEIVVNLSTQRLYAKENNKVLFSGAISSGKKDYRTPTGIFRVIDKERFHISNKYPKPNGGAKMPYMLRLTNYGLAIHQGYLPGFPASHGCIRVGKSTAIKLWRWAEIGTKVKIIGDASDFKYVKKRVSKKKKYAKKKKVRHYAKRRYKKHYVRKWSKKRYKRKRVYAKNHYHYLRSGKAVLKVPVRYEVVEVYDSW